MIAPYPARRADLAAEAAADLLHRLNMKGVSVTASADRKMIDFAAADDGRLTDADVAELRRLKWAVLRLLGLVDLW